MRDAMDKQLATGLWVEKPGWIITQSKEFNNDYQTFFCQVATDMFLQKKSPRYIKNQQENCSHITIEMVIFWNSIPIKFLTFDCSSRVAYCFNCFKPFYNIDWWERLLQWNAIQFFTPFLHTSLEVAQWMLCQLILC